MFDPENSHYTSSSALYLINIPQIQFRYIYMRVSIVIILFVLIIAAALFEVNMYAVLVGFVLAMYQLDVKLCDVIEITTTPEQLQGNSGSSPTTAVDFTKRASQHTHEPEVIVPQPPVEFTSTVRKLPAFDQDIYGPYYAKWNEQRRVYTDSYVEPQPRVGVSCAERQYDVDAAGALLAQKRTVDRQRNDGWAAKDADYYRYHFAEELDTEENLRWWGREEW